MFASFHPKFFLHSFFQYCGLFLFHVRDAPSASFSTVSVYLLCYYWPIFSLSSFSLPSQISSHNSLIICCLHLKSLQFADFSKCSQKRMQCAILAQLWGGENYLVTAFFPALLHYKLISNFLTHLNLFSALLLSKFLTPIDYLCLGLLQPAVSACNFTFDYLLPCSLLLIPLILWLYSLCCTTWNFSECTEIHLFKLLE